MIHTYSNKDLEKMTLSQLKKLLDEGTPSKLKGENNRNFEIISPKGNIYLFNYLEVKAQYDNYTIKVGL
mgnify:CR=1 FL=1|jgi:hypothetical protein|tara:strand:+ start:853 stop:1059 length:207 start_codon:yes stop_codon:yes gene_type:complete